MVMRTLFVWLIFLCSTASAAELRLAGIMHGASRTAIVNDQVVAVGDEIEGYRVVEIGDDRVVFENKAGRVTQYLQEQADHKAPAARPVQAAVTVPVAAPKAPANPLTP